MSTTPRTDAEFFSATTEKPTSGDFELQVVYVDFARKLELELADWKARYESLDHIRCNLDIRLTEAKRELAEVTAAFQKECDHEFVTEDHSFSHEFGTEKIFVCRCEKCGKQKEWDDEGPDSDDGPPERDRDEPDYDAPKPLTPLENHQRNDEHNVR